MHPRFISISDAPIVRLNFALIEAITFLIIHYDTSMKPTQCMKRENFSFVVSKSQKPAKNSKSYL